MPLNGINFNSPMGGSVWTNLGRQTCGPSEEDFMEWTGRGMRSSPPL